MLPNLYLKYNISNTIVKVSIECYKNNNFKDEHYSECQERHIRSDLWLKPQFGRECSCLPRRFGYWHPSFVSSSLLTDRYKGIK